MTYKEELEALRLEINGIDAEMIPLFAKRMAISDKVAAAKAQGNIALVDQSREQAVLDKAAAMVDEGERAEALSFMQTLMSFSKLRQTKSIGLPNPVEFPPSASIPKEPSALMVAFQGVPGAWSEQAAVSLFPEASLLAQDYFEDVFDKVSKGEADFGILPIENSQTGAIGEVYDLLRTHSCFITGQVRIPIAHCLLAKEGTMLSDLREVFSHPEGFNQCRRFLKNKNVDLTACRNTAYAAQKVAKSEGNKYAAIGSRRAAEVHGLSVLVPDIMDQSGNQTRFIAISARPVYSEQSEITSVTFSTQHKSGALCSVLQSFTLSGLNLSRIESRPLSADKYRFFADLQANIMDESTQNALALAAMQCEYFEVLGCY